MLICFSQILHLVQAIEQQVGGSTSLASKIKKVPGLDKSGDELLRRLFQESSYSHGPTKSFEMMELDINREKSPTSDQQITPSLR
jgi:hypothetical protein